MNKVILISVAVVVLTGCATIFSGTSDIIEFQTNPAGAKILVNGIEKGKTPARVKVKRKMGDTYVELKKLGFESKTIVLEQEFNLITLF